MLVHNMSSAKKHDTSNIKVLYTIWGAISFWIDTIVFCEELLFEHQIRHEPKLSNCTILKL